MAIAKRPGTQRQETPPRNNDDAAEAFIAKAGGATQEAEDEQPNKVPVTMRYDRDILKRVDAAAKRLGISRSAYVHIALSRALDQD